MKRRILLTLIILSCILEVVLMVLLVTCKTVAQGGAMAWPPTYFVLMFVVFMGLFRLMELLEDDKAAHNRKHNHPHLNGENNK